jgi:hypothetical protein
MDNVTLTFLNALADMLGVLPQRPKGGPIVRSPRGQLATTPPPVEQAQVRVRGNPNTANPGPQVGQPAGGAGRPQLPPARQPQGYMDTSQRVPTNRRGQARTRLTQAARGSRGTGVTTGRPAPTAASRLGQASGPALLNALGMFLGGKILESAGQPGAANMSLLGGDAPVYASQQEQPQRSTPQPAAQPQAQSEPRQPRQVRYPTAAETIAAAAPPTPVKPPEPPTPKRDWRDVEYMQARKKAMAIKDPVQRQAALEGVTQMGLEFHKDYYGKS